MDLTRRYYAERLSRCAEWRKLTPFGATRIQPYNYGTRGIAREELHRTIDIIDYVHGIGNMMTSPIDSNTFHGGTTGATRVAWLCGPLLESV